MSKNSKKRLVSKLRFPEFRETEVWKERPLSDVLSEHGNKSTGMEVVFSVSVHKGLINQIEHLGRSFSAASTEHYNRVLPGDIVYTKSPTGSFPLGIIKQSKLDFDVIVSPLYGIFSPETIALGTILDAYFESPANVKCFLEPLVQKGAKNTINIKNSKFLSGLLPLPINRKEQQKIADCLTTLDELITAEVDKLEAYKTHKKGLMQKLFPVKGKTVPEWRFPEFRGKGEWDLKPLGTIGKTINGLSGKSGDDFGSGCPFVTYKQVFDYASVDLDKCGRVKISVEEKQNTLKKGDVLFTTSSETPEEVGYASVLLSHPPENTYLNSFCFSLRPSSSQTLVPEFSCYLFHSPIYRKSVSVLAQGSTRFNISKIAFLKIGLPIPMRTEQQKIAECLSSFDELIKAQIQKIEALKTHKKSLMQGLFPSADEVGV